MSPDDWVYAFLLFISVPFGLVIKSLNGATQKRLVSSGTGVALICLVCGINGLHALISSVVSCLIICFLSPRYCHVAAFIWGLGYIGFFRTTVYFGLPPVQPYANAVQLILTLKMIGLACEVHDTYKYEQIIKENSNEVEVKKATLRLKYYGIHPSFTECMLYWFCYVGLLTGPYYKYRTWFDMIHNDNSKNIDSLTPFKHRFKYVPFLSIGYLVATSFYNVKYASTDEFLEYPLWYRYGIMIVTFMVFRTRMYIAWLASECMCFTATLGAYPQESKPRCGQGPTDLEALELLEKEERATPGKTDWETVHNIDMYGCEFNPTVRESMKAWNMTVQFWLASNVYRRVPFKNSQLRVAITMFVSAYWHGVHPGYFMSFLTIPLCLFGEDLMIATFRKGTSPTAQKIFYWTFWLFFRSRSIDYMCIGFLLLTYKNTMHYWGSIYFIPHIYMVVFVALGLFCKSIGFRLGKKEVRDETIGHQNNLNEPGKNLDQTQSQEKTEKQE